MQQISLHWFEDPYHEIMALVFDYWRKYKEAPGAAHIHDLFGDVLDDPHHKKYNLYNRILERMARLHFEGINTQYLLDSLGEFVRKQDAKRTLFVAGTALSQGDLETTYREFDSFARRKDRIGRSGLVTVRGSDVILRAPTWLWPNY